MCSKNIFHLNISWFLEEEEEEGDGGWGLCPAGFQAIKTFAAFMLKGIL